MSLPHCHRHPRPPNQNLAGPPIPRPQGPGTYLAETLARWPWPYRICTLWLMDLAPTMQECPGTQVRWPRPQCGLVFQKFSDTESRARVLVPALLLTHYMNLYKWILQVVKLFNSLDESQLLIFFPSQLIGFNWDNTAFPHPQASTWQWIKNYVFFLIQNILSSQKNYCIDWC